MKHSLVLTLFIGAFFVMHAFAYGGAIPCACVYGVTKEGRIVKDGETKFIGDNDKSGLDCAAWGIGVLSEIKEKNNPDKIDDLQCETYNQEDALLSPETNTLIDPSEMQKMLSLYN